MIIFDKVSLGQHFPSVRKLVPILVLSLGIIIGAGAMAPREPLLVIGLTAVAIALLVMMIWQDAPTLAVLFLIYTNASVIAVQFHGVPFIIGSAVPALLLLPLASILIARRQSIRIDVVSLLLLLFLVVQLLGAFWAVSLDRAMDELITFLVEGIGIYILILNTVRTKKLLRYATWTIVIAGLLLGLVSFYQQATGTTDNNYWGFAQISDASFGTGETTIQGEVQQPRLGGPLGQNNRYAQIMLVLLPLALFLFWSAPSSALRILGIAAAGFILIGATLTFSRGGIVGLALMLTIMAFMRYIKGYQIVLIILGLALIMLMFPQYGTRLSSLQELTNLTNRDSSGIEAADGSIRSRVTEMGAAALMFVDHPIVGVGPGMYRYYYRHYAEIIGIRIVGQYREAHNLFLGLAAEHGILGLLIIGAVIYATLNNLSRSRKYWQERDGGMANLATGYILAIVVYLTTGLFLHFAYIRYFWLIMGLAGALVYTFEAEMTQAEEMAREHFAEVPQGA